MVHRRQRVRSGTPMETAGAHRNGTSGCRHRAPVPRLLMRRRSVRPAPSVAPRPPIRLRLRNTPCSGLEPIRISGAPRRLLALLQRRTTPPSQTTQNPTSRVHHNGRSVGEGGLEPPRPCGHRHLKPARLPIPPLARVDSEDYQRALPSGPGSTSRFNQSVQRGSVAAAPEVGRDEALVVDVGRGPTHTR